MIEQFLFVINRSHGIVTSIRPKIVCYDTFVKPQNNLGYVTSIRTIVAGYSTWAVIVTVTLIRTIEVHGGPIDGTQDVSPQCHISPESIRPLVISALCLRYM